MATQKLNKDPSLLDYRGMNTQIIENTGSLHKSEDVLATFHGREGSNLKQIISLVDKHVKSPKDTDNERELRSNLTSVYSFPKHKPLVLPQITHTVRENIQFNDD